MIDKNEKLEEFFEKSSVFSTLSKDDRLTLLEDHVFLKYKKGDILYKEGEKPMGLFCITDGKVKVFKEGVGGRDQIVRMAKPFGYVGFRALFADENFSSSAVAIEESAAFIIDKYQLVKVLQGNSQLALNFLKFISVELGFANNRTVTLTQKHIRGRLAESLLFLKDTYGYAEDGATIKVYLSREDIANLSNMTTSNAIRTLSTFNAEKVISIDGRKLKILDLRRLERISEMG
jgi:CRP/FNR family transcriptional regulator, polysaccharide utilization system transcription regulator